MLITANFKSSILCKAAYFLCEIILKMLKNEDTSTRVLLVANKFESAKTLDRMAAQIETLISSSLNLKK